HPKLSPMWASNPRAGPSPSHLRKPPSTDSRPFLCFRVSGEARGEQPFHLAGGAAQGLVDCAADGGRRQRLLEFRAGLDQASLVIDAFLRGVFIREMNLDARQLRDESRQRRTDHITYMRVEDGAALHRVGCVDLDSQRGSPLLRPGGGNEL